MRPRSETLKEPYRTLAQEMREFREHARPAILDNYQDRDSDESESSR